jgi:hypothetical protein
MPAKVVSLHHQAIARDGVAPAKVTTGVQLDAALKDIGHAISQTQAHLAVWRLDFRQHRATPHLLRGALAKLRAE